jgi:hypothetical protein
LNLGEVVLEHDHDAPSMEASERRAALAGGARPLAASDVLQAP